MKKEIIILAIALVCLSTILNSIAIILNTNEINKVKRIYCNTMKCWQIQESEEEITVKQEKQCIHYEIDGNQVIRCTTNNEEQTDIVIISGEDGITDIIVNGE